MKTFRFARSYHWVPGFVSGLMLSASAALAQPAETQAPIPASGASETQTPPESEAGSVPVSPTAQPTHTTGTESVPPETHVERAAPVRPVSPGPTVPLTTTPAEEAPVRWFDKIAFGSCVDAYYAFNHRNPRPHGSGSSARAFDLLNGFNLAAVGADASIGPDPVGASIQLRFSPFQSAYAGVDGTQGLALVKQAFGQWRPGGKDGRFTLDMGKFDTLFGAEVVNSWENHNYTRGVVFWLAQPLFHVGARATYQITPQLDAKMMVVNGWSNNADQNLAKSVGVQLNYVQEKAWAASLGWYVGAEQPDTFEDSGTRHKITENNSRYRHLVDAVVRLSPTEPLSIVVNADYGTEQAVVDPVKGETHQMSWYGVMLSGRYKLSETYALGLRGEVYADPQGYTVAGMAAKPNEDGTYPSYLIETGTLTLEAAPSENLVIRLDNRIDLADQAIFASSLGETEKSQWTATLGLVFKTN